MAHLRKTTNRPLQNHNPCININPSMGRVARSAQLGLCKLVAENASKGIGQVNHFSDWKHRTTKITQRAKVKSCRGKWINRQSIIGNNKIW